MRLLVAGANRVDAGKTTFSVGLVARTNAVGYKPRAGNDYWFDHDDYRRAVEEGRLYGKDAKRLAAASPGEVRPEAINPIHRLWRPSPGPASGLLGQDDREFVLDRVGETYVVNATVDVPDSARQHLPLEEAVRVDSLAAFNDVMAETHLPAQRALADDVAAADRAVVESYGDVARPYASVDPDAVAVVEPGRARVYDGQRYAKGCEVAIGGPGDGQLEERVGSVVDLVDPEATVGLPPLTDVERDDPAAVADAYDHAYDALLATAFE
ncbi:MAG: ATPase [Haloarculaceae archaeon]